MTDKKAQIWGCTFNTFGVHQDKPILFYESDWDAERWWAKNGNDSIPYPKFGLNFKTIDGFGSFSSYEYTEVQHFINGFNTAYKVLKENIFKWVK